MVSDAFFFSCCLSGKLLFLIGLRKKKKRWGGEPCETDTFWKHKGQIFVFLTMPRKREGGEVSVSQQEMRGASYLCTSALNASHVSVSQSMLLYLPTLQWHVQNKLVGSPLHCTGCHVKWVWQTVSCDDGQLGRELDPTCTPSGCVRRAWLRGQAEQVLLEFLPAAFSSLSWCFVLI